MLIRAAVLDDTQDIVAIVNAAYRKNEPGAWFVNPKTNTQRTSEMHLLNGDRINQDTVINLINNPHLNPYIPRILVASHMTNHQILIGTLELEVEENGKGVVFGLFSISAKYQSKGIGKTLLTHGINMVKSAGFRLGVIYVIGVRDDLIQWYLRYGFVDTGCTKLIKELDGLSKGPDIVFKRLELQL